MKEADLTPNANAKLIEDGVIPLRRAPEQANVGLKDGELHRSSSCQPHPAQRRKLHGKAWWWLSKEINDSGSNQGALEVMWQQPLVLYAAHTTSTEVSSVWGLDLLFRGAREKGGSRCRRCAAPSRRGEYGAEALEEGAGAVAPRGGYVGATIGCIGVREEVRLALADAPQVVAGLGIGAGAIQAKYGSGCGRFTAIEGRRPTVVVCSGGA
ncbi:hypothetical protein EJB05_30384, partial [Eragrostis curvula]